MCSHEHDNGDSKCLSPRGDALNTWNRQLMMSGRSQMVTTRTRNYGNWHTVVGEIHWSPMPETTMDCHSKLVEEHSASADHQCISRDRLLIPSP